MPKDTREGWQGEDEDLVIRKSDHDVAV